MAQRTVTATLLWTLLSIIVSLVIVASVSAAQAAPSIFATKDACEEAVLSGTYTEYIPKHFRNHTKNPVDGKKRVMAPLEARACVLMDTTLGRKWVIQEPGVEFRFHIEDVESGVLKQPPYARHDCGNKVYDISYPQEGVTEPAQKKDTLLRSREEKGNGVKTVPEKAPIRDVCKEWGYFGEEFTSRLDNDGNPYCHENTPWYKSGWVQYPVNIVAGGTAGYLKGGERGAIVGALSGSSGTYLGRVIAGEGNEEWGWVGFGTGILGGAIPNFGKGKKGGGGGNNTPNDPSGGGWGIE